MTKSQPTADLLDFERDLPTTPEDIEMSRRLRAPAPHSLLHRLDALAPPGLFGPPPRRTTFVGFEPFEL